MKTMKVQEVKVGDRVWVRGGFNREPEELVLVEDIDEKNDMPTICYTDSTGSGRWAYFDQITRFTVSGGAK